MSQEPRTIIMEASEELSISNLTHVIGELEERLEDRKQEDLENHFS